MNTMMRAEIEFPAGIAYGAALGGLRVALKSFLHVAIRKRRWGATLSAADWVSASAMLVLPEGYKVRETGSF